MISIELRSRPREVHLMMVVLHQRKNNLNLTKQFCGLTSLASLQQRPGWKIPCIVLGELFPSEVRAFCKGLTRSFSCILLVLSLKFFPVLEFSLTFYGTFYFFAAVLILSVPVVYFTVPETKDLGLEQIQHYFTKSRTIFYVDLEPENDGSGATADVTSGPKCGIHRTSLCQCLSGSEVDVGSSNSCVQTAAYGAV